MLLAIEAWILFEIYVGFEIMPEGGGIGAQTFVIPCIPLVLIATVLIFRKR